MALKPETRDKLKTVSTATIATALYKRGFRNQMMQDVRPLDPTKPTMVGEAFTLRYIPAREDLDTMALYATDESLHRRAIEECPPGAVLVMATGGDVRASSMGDMMALRLAVRGVAGVVTDGGFRDTPGIAATGLPCFQRMPSGPATPITLSPVAFNDPVGCAGVAVYPGDIIVADASGAVVIPAHLAEEIADEVISAGDYEEFAAAHVRAGRSLFGLFPATDDSRREFDAWVSAGRPEIHQQETMT